MSFSSDLLAAGFSAVLGKKVMTQMQFEEFKKTPEGRNAVSKKLTIDETFQATYQRSDDEAIRTCQWRYQMFIHTPSGRQVSVFIYHCSTIADLKRVIARRLDIPAEEIRLTFRSQELRDNNKTIGDYNITDNSNITVLLRVRGGGPTEVYIFDESMRDSGFDYDFSSVPDDGQTYYRGPHQYFRPYGWMRFALKVRGKYRNDDWLGAAGMRTNTTSGEWSVSYHGTKRENADSIGRGGYDLRKGKRFLHGKGIYSSPSIHVASGDLYAEEFSHKGNSYKLVFQNRCNPNRLEIVSTASGEYWISPNEDDIRPYGICLKKLNSKVYTSAIARATSAWATATPTPTATVAPYSSTSDSSCTIQ